jgi:ATP phosphoribosyltransferase regulatory subunit
MENYRKEEEFVIDFEKIFESYGYGKIKRSRNCPKGYISDVRNPILSRERYDKLVIRFGKDTSALGFCLEIDNYFESIQRERTKIDYLLLYSSLENGFEALEKAREYRKYGKTVRVLSEEKSESPEALKENY